VLFVVLGVAETGLVGVEVGAAGTAEGVDVLAVPFICASMFAISSFKFPDDPLLSLASGCSWKEAKQVLCRIGSRLIPAKSGRQDYAPFICRTDGQALQPRGQKGYLARRI